MTGLLPRMAAMSSHLAATGLALINSVGNLGGFVGPSLVGFAREATNGFAGGHSWSPCRL